VQITFTSKELRAQRRARCNRVGLISVAPRESCTALCVTFRAWPSSRCRRWNMPRPRRQVLFVGAAGREDWIGGPASEVRQEDPVKPPRSRVHKIIELVALAKPEEALRVVDKPAEQPSSIRRRDCRRWLAARRLASEKSTTADVLVLLLTIMLR